MVRILTFNKDPYDSNLSKLPILPDEDSILPIISLLPIELAHLYQMVTGILKYHIDRRKKQRQKEELFLSLQACIVHSIESMDDNCYRT